MRIAIFSDIHGNVIALDAVLADIRAQGGVDATWVLGDYAAIGYDPVGVLERLNQLPNTRFVRGNTDRYVATGALPRPTLVEVKNDMTLLPGLMEVTRSFAWTQGAVSSNGWLDWLSQLPIEQRLTLPDGTRMLGVHASAGKDDGRGAYPGIGEAELAGLMQGCNADLVFVGHTHGFVDMMVNGIRVVNPGSVSNSFPQDLRAGYVMLDADEHSYRVTPHRVDYDRDAVIASVRKLQHPATDFIVQYMLGQNKPHWSKSSR